MVSRRQFLSARFFTPSPARRPIGASCLAYRQTVCRVCAEACGVQAIRFAPVPGAAAVPQLDTDACNGCGACVSVCPVQAISVEALASTSERSRISA